MTTAAPGIELPDEVFYDIAELGEGLILKNRRTIEFTPQFASDFLEIAEFTAGDEKIDRNLQMDHVIYLARQMEGGMFRWEQVNLMVCLCEGGKYRMNGQHTAWARVTANLPEGVRTPVQLLTYEAATFQDMRQLYASIDRGKGRNRGNVVVSYLGGSDEFPGYSKGTLRKLASGLTWHLWENQDQRRLHNADEVSYLLLKDYHRTALAVGTLLNESKPADSKHINRQPVWGAMFATFAKAPQIAREFWIHVRDGVGIANKDDPRHTLRNFLMSSGLAASRLHNGDTKTVSPEDMYRASLLTWNAHRQGRSLKQIRVNSLTERPEAR